MPSTSIEKSGRLQGRRIVVTGGASGIGREIASLARAEGARVGLFDRDKNALHKVVQDLGVSCPMSLSRSAMFLIRRARIV